jgi:predicted restriction endonuclease
MTFKKAVLASCGGRCEVPGCEEEAITVHHFFKQSTFPEYREDPDNGMGACGNHHAIIEQKLRANKEDISLYPRDRLLKMVLKARKKLGQQE